MHAILHRYELTDDESILGARTHYQDDRADIYYSDMCLASNETLFVATFDISQNDGSQDEILAFDATTLNVRFRFGRGLFRGKPGEIYPETFPMAFLGQELFVYDEINDRIRVFSISGEHLRDITGDWDKLSHLLAYNGRLFLVEQGSSHIFVLTPDGQTLQKYSVRAEDGTPARHISKVHILGTKLIVSYQSDTKALLDGGTRFLTLKGL